MHEERFSLKRGVLSLMLCALWAVTGYVVFVGAVCLWVGVCHVHWEGFWMPLLIGGLTIGVALPVACSVAGILRSALGRREEASEPGWFNRG